ncbi:hypothetical protein D8I24_4145 [Cupriavidus necator H850]|nr:hypothetical protein D8I24_4145 [Cupriavidus necator H850]
MRRTAWRAVNSCCLLTNRRFAPLSRLRERGWGRGPAYGKRRNASLRGDSRPLPRPSPINGRGEQTGVGCKAVVKKRRIRALPGPMQSMGPAP